MSNFVLPLASETLTLAQAGGKGVNLQKLIAAGFPTPAGFVITTEAYRAFVAANSLAAEIERLSAATDPGRPESFEAASQALRAQFERGRLPEALSEAIRAAYLGLAAGGAAVAVRSSATAEDLPDASFAGQQETYLHIRGEAAVLAAVQRCWGSLWTARAMAYRGQQGVAPDGVALAVVIQPMVPAAAAGVLFTLNPVTGERTEAVINAAWGLGEALVSGQVNPDTVIVDKASGAVKSLAVGEKAVMTAPAEAGTAEVAVDPARRGQPALTPAQAAALTQLGRAIEAHFGAPQDIEWALADGQWAILQTRPITAHGGVPGDDDWPPRPPAAPQPYDRWSQADFGERWPEPVTPLTWSFWEALTNEGFYTSLEAIPSPLPRQTQWSRRAYGRLYMNEGALLHIYTRELGMPTASIAASIGVQGQAGPAAGWNWGVALRRAPVLLRMMRTMQHHARHFEAEFPKIDAWVDAFMGRGLGGASDAELWREGLDVWRRRLVEYLQYHTSVTGLSASQVPLLEDLLQNWLGDRTLAQPVLAGLTGVIQAEMVPALQALAQTLRDLGLASVVLDQPPAAAWAQLQTLPAAGPALRQLAAFLQRHGHRCATEAEWLYPRWIEAPELVLQALIPYLQGDGAARLADNEARQRQRRAEAEARLAARLDPFRRAYLRWALAEVQRLVRLRDNGQNYLIKLLLPWRHLLAELGRRWAE
ncbi:MAG: hypothetical protein JNK29_13070, partial [Anaerolineales bacterium]|nr:hypothetical protein [Anaerolineales bacterium]